MVFCHQFHEEKPRHNAKGVPFPITFLIVGHHSTYPGATSSSDQQAASRAQCGKVLQHLRTPSAILQTQGVGAYDRF